MTVIAVVRNQLLSYLGFRVNVGPLVREAVERISDDSLVISLSRISFTHVYPNGRAILAHT